MPTMREQVLQAVDFFRLPAKMARYLNAQKSDVLDWLSQLEREGLVECFGRGRWRLISKTKAKDQPMGVMQSLSDCGINPFGAQLLAESLLKHPDCREISFILPVRRSDCAGWAGVVFKLTPLTNDEWDDRFEAERNVAELHAQF